MSDRDALLAAIRAQPDEDTPRLVFADWLEENDEPARAEFIRAQVELARTPPWEPFAVRCRWQRPGLLTGQAFLRELHGASAYVEWAKPPFWRGFGWAIEVRAVALWEELAEPLFAREPIGKVSFWHGTLDDWRRVASSPCVRQFRELVFHLNASEPLFALRDRPEACGVADLHLRRASSAGMPEMLEDLFASPMGRSLRGLHLHTGYESRRELVGAINAGGPLERLSFSVMGMTDEYLRQLLDGPSGASLTELHFRNEPLGWDGLIVLAYDAPPGLTDLTLSGVGLTAEGMESLSRSERLASLRRLSLSGNALPRATRVLSLSRSLAGLRSIDLSSCRVGDKGVRHLTRAKFWPNLVEVNLRDNPISAACVRYLLDAPPQPDLAALVLDAGALGPDGRAALARKYGPAAIFAAGEVAA
jgi:uncharacterized protein (TIGR02996 family)